MDGYRYLRAYTLTTIERDPDGNLETKRKAVSGSLASLVNLAKRRGWMPGNVSGTGLTIVEVCFEGGD